MSYTANSPERPRYRILATAGFYGPDDNLYLEGEEIYFDGVPNEEMEALNETAHVKLVAYLEELDNKGREVAEKLGRPFVGRPRNFDGQIALATALQKDDMAIMGAKKESPEIARAAQMDTPDTGAKRGRGRPKTVRAA